jgi:hypothetical protein
MLRTLLVVMCLVVGSAGCQTNPPGRVSVGMNAVDYKNNYRSAYDISAMTNCLTSAPMEQISGIA